MTQYIDKSILVTELRKRIRDYWSDSESAMKIYPCALKEVIKYIDTLEVKEVNLEKEFCDYFEKNFKISISGILLSNNDEPINTLKLLDFAKHFFELGITISNKIQKGE